MVNNSWDAFLKSEFGQPYFQELSAFLKEQYATKTIFPQKREVFSAFSYFGIEATKVVILGQDPYHQPNQAHGLSFSVRPRVALPPSLRNIYKELVNDCGVAMPTSGCLVPWAQQGVLLLNAVLTVEHSKPNSHQNKGWETFSDHVIALLNNQNQPMVFIFWGKNAQAKMPLITNPRHHIIYSAHPSPFSAHYGFFESRPFSRTNDFLIKHQRTAIDWRIQ